MKRFEYKYVEQVNINDINNLAARGWRIINSKKILPEFYQVQTGMAAKRDYWNVLIERESEVEDGIEEAENEEV